MATRIYVGNLPYTADNDQLAQLFAVFGEVIEAAIIMDRDTGRSKGFGFVQMTNEGDRVTERHHVWQPHDSCQ